MFSRPLFEVFHEGYWYGPTQPPAPTWYLIVPAMSDAYEIATWKIKENSLPLRKFDELGRGIPLVDGGVQDSILITSYLKSEISQFLSALNISATEYNFKSVKVFQPKLTYQSTPLYNRYMRSIRRSVGLRSRVRGWFR
jgi:hypothetical protein